MGLLYIMNNIYYQYYILIDNKRVLIMNERLKGDIKAKWARKERSNEVSYRIKMLSIFFFLIQNIIYLIYINIY